MKQIFFLLAISLVLISGGLAQSPVRENQVPPAVKEDFARRFPTAEKVTWLQQGSDYYGVRYSIGEQAGEVIYLPDGQWVQTSEEVAYKDLPDQAREHCRGKYADYSAWETKKLSTRKYGILYKLKIRKETEQVTMTFDMHGKVIEETSESLEMEKEKKPGLKKLFGR